jgi:hypothetical protein
MKIISFNVGTTHLMHYNKRVIAPKGETAVHKNERADIIKQTIEQSVTGEHADFLCIQEGFDEVFPGNNRFGHLECKLPNYEIKHGPIANFNSSYLATYYDPTKYTMLENTHFEREYQRQNVSPGGFKFPCRTQMYDVTTRADGSVFLLVNVHGMGIPDISIRRKFLEFLSNYLTTHYNSQDVIIVGDINTNIQRTKGDDDEVHFAGLVKNTFFRDFDIYPENDHLRNKSSYHRFIRQPDNTFTDKPPNERYDCLDYCLVKKSMNKDVGVKRVPDNFVKKEVPYKLPSAAGAATPLEPNFEEFPSDHTLNVYTVEDKHSPVTLYPIKQSKKPNSAPEFELLRHPPEAYRQTKSDPGLPLPKSVYGGKDPASKKKKQKPSKQKQQKQQKPSKQKQQKPSKKKKQKPSKQKKQKPSKKKKQKPSKQKKQKPSKQK